jgi:hypothetical protein
MEGREEGEHLVSAQYSSEINSFFALFTFLQTLDTHFSVVSASPRVVSNWHWSWYW